VQAGVVWGRGVGLGRGLYQYLWWLHLAGHLETFWRADPLFINPGPWKCMEGIRTVEELSTTFEMIEMIDISPNINQQIRPIKLKSRSH
jgi:hypothetical protein